MQKPSEHVFDGFSYAIEGLGIDGGYVLIEAAGIN